MCHYFSWLVALSRTLSHVGEEHVGSLVSIHGRWALHSDLDGLPDPALMSSVRMMLLLLIHNVLLLLAVLRMADL